MHQILFLLTITKLCNLSPHCEFSTLDSFMPAVMRPQWQLVCHNSLNSDSI